MEREAVAGRVTSRCDRPSEREVVAVERMRATGDWSPQEMEEAGRHVLATVAKYVAELEETPVLPDIGAAELRQLLGDALPQQPENFADIVADTERRIIPHLTLWNHPRFFAYFPVGSSGPGAMADLLASALNINGMLWKTAPAAAALEEVVLRWLAEMAGYDVDADGVLINGASLATFYALAAAREVAGLDIREKGMTGRDLPTMRVYASGARAQLYRQSRHRARGRFGQLGESGDGREPPGRSEGAAAARAGRCRAGLQAAGGRRRRRHDVDGRGRSD